MIKSVMSCSLHCEVSNISGECWQFWGRSGKVWPIHWGSKPWADKVDFCCQKFLHKFNLNWSGSAQILSLNFAMCWPMSWLNEMPPSEESVFWWAFLCPHTPIMRKIVRENFKYYFADFVRKGGGGVTPQIRNLYFGPKSGVSLAKNTMFRERFKSKKRKKN